VRLILNIWILFTKIAKHQIFIRRYVGIRKSDTLIGSNIFVYFVRKCRCMGIVIVFTSQNRIQRERSIGSLDLYQSKKISRVFVVLFCIEQLIKRVYVNETHWLLIVSTIWRIQKRIFSWTITCSVIYLSSYRHWNSFASCLLDSFDILCANVFELDRITAFAYLTLHIVSRVNLFGKPELFTPQLRMCDSLLRLLFVRLFLLFLHTRVIIWILTLITLSLLSPTWISNNLGLYDTHVDTSCFRTASLIMYIANGLWRFFCARYYIFFIMLMLTAV